MTVRIIKQPPQFQAIKVACIGLGGCGTEFVADSPDDFSRRAGSDQRDGDSWDYAIIACPTCSNIVSVTPDRFPVHVYEKLRFDR